VIAKGEGDGLMPWESYRKLIDEVGPYLMAIALWRWGEPLLHPQIVDMVEAARRREVLTMISTNAQAQPESLDLGGLFRAGLDLLIISMDGATQETQSHFRKGSRLDAVRRFTETAVTMRRNLGLTNPVINLRTIAVRENESEIGQLLGFARTVGVDYYTVKSVSLYYDDAPTNPELPLDLSLRSLQYRGWEEARQYRDAPNHCLKPWSWPTLGHDGTLLACECDHRDERPLGNVFTAPSFRHVWRGADAQELRSHFPADGRPDCPFCLRCRYKLDDAIPIVRYLRADRP
jgi:MoaA/NifB/PqqE/SkfB family radical SAM enzyme